ncbi:MAG: lamin tail domain-containing protein [Candidatus Eisenbacteria bacterium]
MLQLRTIGRALLMVCALFVNLAWTERASAEVYLNEIVWTPNGSVIVELYNRSTSQADISGWVLQTNRGAHVIPQNTTIEANDRIVIASVGGLFDPIGGMLGIIDDLERTQDRVRYGILGGAPSPPPATGMSAPSLARSPDASSPTAPPRSPGLDGYFWTIDLTPTPNAENDVPNPDLGRDICINEILQDPNGVLADSVEICGPATFAGGGTSLSGWYFTTPAGVQYLSGTVPASGLLGIEVDPALMLGTTYRIDLFDPTGVRVYQKSIYGVPTPPAISHGDCPDGAAPPDGWDYFSCGGGSTYFPLHPSIGSSNAPGGSCQDANDPPSDEEPEDPNGNGDQTDGDGGKGDRAGSRDDENTRIESWGKVKHILGGR